MLTPDGRLVLAYYGKIYNFQELLFDREAATNPVNDHSEGRENWGS